MSEKILDIDIKIDKILTQTNYTKEIALQKLKENNFNEFDTIQEYLNISKTNIISINQEIYKQIRLKLNSNLSDYKKRVEKGEHNFVKL